jgi:hypothetical protein
MQDVSTGVKQTWPVVDLNVPLGQALHWRSLDAVGATDYKHTEHRAKENGECLEWKYPISKCYSKRTKALMC